MVGIVVDAVSDTHNIAAEAIRPAPDFGGPVSVDYLQGLATVNETMVIVLDIDRLLSVEELRMVGRVSEQSG